MDAIILHDREEEQIGTVLLKGNTTFDDVTDAWDKYLNEIKDSEANIYDFVSQGNWEMCEVLNVDFYQPN